MNNKTGQGLWPANVSGSFPARQNIYTLFFFSFYFVLICITHVGHWISLFVLQHRCCWLAFLCYWHKWWQTPGKYPKVNDQLRLVAVKQSVWPSVTVLCTIAVTPYYFGDVGNACFGPVRLTDGLPAALQSLPTVTIWVCFCCLQIFFLHLWWHYDNFKASRGLLLGTRPGCYHRMWEYGSTTSIKGWKKGIFLTSSDVVALFSSEMFPNQSCTSRTVLGNVVERKAQISRNDADALSSHLFLIRLCRV